MLNYKTSGLIIFGGFFPSKYEMIFVAAIIAIFVLASNVALPIWGSNTVFFNCINSSFRLIDNSRKKQRERNFE